MEELYKIELDIDRDRIRTILGEAYEQISNLLKISFWDIKENFVSKIDPYLSSNRITTNVFLDLPSDMYPEMKIEVNIRRKGVFVRMGSKKKQALVNRYIKNL